MSVSGVMRGSLERIVVFIGVCACISLFLFFAFPSEHNDYVDNASFIGLQSPGLLAEFSSDFDFDMLVFASKSKTNMSNKFLICVTVNQYPIS